MHRNVLPTIAIAALLLGACGTKGSEVPKTISQPEDPRIAAVVMALRPLPALMATDIEAAVRAEPGRFLELLDAALVESTAHGGLLALVDKKNALPPGYEPGDLVSLNAWPLAATRKDLRLRKVVLDAVLAMNGAALADGVELVFASSYRSYEYQDGLFKRYAASHGEAEASRFSAKPGTSQHQLGTAIDFDPIDEAFAATPAGVWMAANGWRYGFSLSFPPGMEETTGYIWESWHYRYITRPGALLEKDYFSGVQQYFIEFLDAYSKIPR
jgi:D-alanyl-D-alanine carboxypeptidase